MATATRGEVNFFIGEMVVFEKGRLVIEIFKLMGPSAMLAFLTWNINILMVLIQRDRNDKFQTSKDQERDIA